MNAITRLFSDSVVHALGWTMLHSLWQGGIIVLLLGLSLAGLRRYTPRLRYLARIFAIAFLPVAAGITFSRMMVAEPSLLPSHAEHTGQVELIVPPAVIPASPDVDRALPGMPEKLIPSPAGFSQKIDQVLPWLVILWILGVSVLSIRSLSELLLIRRLCRRHSRPAPFYWYDRLTTLITRMGVRRDIALRESLHIATPMVVGVLRPVILFPVSLLASLPPDQVESALAHELAHIRRQDFLVNLLQTFVEILLFFNPAVWLISSFLRAEREHSCDDWAVSATGDRLSLIKALAALEQYRSAHLRLAVRLSGRPGSLLVRIRRLSGREASPLPYRTFWSALLLLFFVTLAAFNRPQSSPGLEDLTKEILPDTLPNPVAEPQKMPKTVTPTPKERPGAPESPIVEPTASPSVWPVREAEETARPALVSPAWMTSDTIPVQERKRRELEREYQAKIQELEVERQALEEQMQKVELDFQKMENEHQLHALDFARQTQTLSAEQARIEEETQSRQLEQREKILDKEMQLKQLQDELTISQFRDSTDRKTLREKELKMQQLMKERLELENQIGKMDLDRERQNLELRKKAREYETQQHTFQNDVEKMRYEKQAALLELQQKMQLLNSKHRALDMEYQGKLMQVEEN